MPQHTSKSRSDNKRIVLAEPSKPAKAKGVTRTVDKNIKGLAYETRPVHNPNPADKILPAREDQYMHKTGLQSKPSEREQWAKAAHKRNLPLDQILIGSGFTVDNLFACLGIPRKDNDKLYEWLLECKNKHNSI